MIDFIYNIPTVLLFILINLFTISISIAAVFLVRRYFPLKSRFAADEVMGYISATLCILYAVLVGFIALYSLNNYNKAETITEQEASLLAEIYRDSNYIGEPTRSAVQSNVKHYLEEVINNEWPEMRSGKAINYQGIMLLDEIHTQLHMYQTKNDKETFITQEMLRHLTDVYQTREARIYLTGSALDFEAWIVILVGAFLVISINYLFGMSFHVHIISVIYVSIMVSSAVFLVVVLDRPFRGYSVPPYAYQSILEAIDHKVNP